MTDAQARPAGYDDANDYTRIIVDEALRRGIDVVIGDPSLGELTLTHDGRTVRAFESLSELTSAVAFRRCDDKLLTRRVLEGAGLRVSPGRLATDDDADEAFLAEHGEIVVKPCQGEGGAGITVGVVDTEGLDAARRSARAQCDRVLLEAVAPGDDLRVLVIDGAVVAAAVRRPPSVVGNGTDPIRALIEAHSARRAEETGGVSTVPLDEITEATVRAAGHAMDDVLDDGVELRVRRTANLHTGGTIHDVTDELHPALAEVALRAADAIGLPVAGVDLMVEDHRELGHVLIEVNEQPGLANHEPRPTAPRYLDLLFPETAGR